jgi:hypothetical protein
MKSSCYFLFSHSGTKISPGPLTTLHCTLLNSNSIFPWLSPTENCTAVPMVKISPLHGPHVKLRLLLLRMRAHSFCNLALGTAQTTLKTSHAIAISPVHWRADFCLTTTYKYSSYYCVRLSKVFIAPLPSYTRYKILLWQWNMQLQEVLQVWRMNYGINVH